MKFTALTISALVALTSVSATPAPIGERSIEERQWNVTPCGGDQVVSVKVGGYIEYRDGARDYCNGMLGQRCDKVCHDGGNIHD